MGETMSSIGSSLGSSMRQNPESWVRLGAQLAPRGLRTPLIAGAGLYEIGQGPEREKAYRESETEAQRRKEKNEPPLTGTRPKKPRETEEIASKTGEEIQKLQQAEAQRREEEAKRLSSLNPMMIAPQMLTPSGGGAPRPMGQIPPSQALELLARLMASGRFQFPG